MKFFNIIVVKGYNFKNIKRMCVYNNLCNMYNNIINYDWINNWINIYNIQYINIQFIISFRYIIIIQKYYFNNICYNNNKYSINNSILFNSYDISIENNDSKYIFNIEKIIFNNISKNNNYSLINSIF